MSRFRFQTISDELLDCAEQAAEYFDLLGYRVTIEPTELAFPGTPAFKGKRQNTRLIVIAAQSIDRERIAEWVAYCKTAQGDMRFVLVHPSSANVGDADQLWLRDQKVGLLAMAGEQVIEVIPSQDLALQLSLPDLKGLSRPVRTLVGPIYEKVKAGNWHDGFEDACRILESKSRKYLKQGCKCGRLKFVDKKGKPYALASKRIEKMTMGALAIAFSEIVV